MIDNIDKEILNMLRINSKITHKEIGAKLFLTGQSVGQRIKRLEYESIIKNYTIHIDEMIYQNYLQAYITTFMNGNNLNDFLHFIKVQDIVTDANKISGEGCYILVLKVDNYENLVAFLDELLKYCTYKLNISVKKVK